jgi:hypothetical protein
MVAKLMQDAGLALGQESDLLVADKDNPAGYWENRHFVELNDDLLASAGGGWDHPPPWPPSWSTSPRFADLWARARDLVAQFEGARWGWKDPRNSLTLTFWAELVPELRVVIAVRNPLEVAASLRTRNQFSPAHSFSLWLAHHERLLGVMPADQRLVTSYETLLADVAEQTARLATFAGLEADSSVLSASAQTADSRLRHHDFDPERLAHEDVPDDVRDLYLQLCDEAQAPVHSR